MNKEQIEKIALEVVAWACWLDSDDEMPMFRAQLTRFEPIAYRNRLPLVRHSDAARLIAERDANVRSWKKIANDIGAECDTLRARVAEMEKARTELVAQVGYISISSRDFSVPPSKDLSIFPFKGMAETGLKAGDKLYAAPPDSAAIIAKLTTERESFYKVAMERNEQFVQTCTEVERLSNLNQTMAAATVGLRQEVESLAADRDEWIACHAKVFRELQETKALVADKRAELAAANERIAALEQDAARYQWLRENNIVANVRFNFGSGESHYLYAECLDEAIDAAIKEVQG